MATATTTPLTAESFAAFVGRPQNADRWFELERGEIVEWPPPKKPHGVVCGNVARLLGNFAVAAKFGYVTTNDAGFITERGPDSVRGPDVAFWRDAEPVDANDPQYSETPPIIAVEVLSPDDRINRLNNKIGEYLRSGVLEVWVIDPAARDMAIHRAGADPQFLTDNDELKGKNSLSGFRCHVADLFHSLVRH